MEKHNKDRKRTHWKKEEINFLRENYEKGVEYCSHKLGRTIMAIKVKAKRLRIFNSPEIKHKHYSDSARKQWANKIIRGKKIKNIRK